MRRGRLMPWLQAPYFLLLLQFYLGIVLLLLGLVDMAAAQTSRNATTDPVEGAISLRFCVCTVYVYIYWCNQELFVLSNFTHGKISTVLYVLLVSLCSWWWWWWVTSFRPFQGGYGGGTARTAWISTRKAFFQAGGSGRVWMLDQFFFSTPFPEFICGS